MERAVVTLAEVIKDHPSVTVKLSANDYPDILNVKVFDVNAMATQSKAVNLLEFDEQVAARGLGGYLLDNFGILKEC